MITINCKHHSPSLFTAALQAQQYADLLVDGQKEYPEKNYTATFNDIEGEFIILRILRRVREGVIHRTNILIIDFEGNKITPTEDGDLDKNFKPHFFEYRAEDLF